MASQATPSLPGVAAGLSARSLIIVTWCGFGLAFSFVCLRIYARLTETRRLYTDDCWILVALIFLLANAILQTLQTVPLYYMLRAEVGLEPADFTLIAAGDLYIKYEFVIISFFWSTTWSVKASFLAMYYRLFAGMAAYRKLWWGVVLFTAGSYVGCWFASVWTCHPPSSYFKFGACSKPIDHTGSIISVSYSTSVDILTDFMIMALPLRMLHELQVSRKQKLGLASIFSVGFIVVATALIRLSQIVGKSYTDPVGLAVWGIVESSISLVVGSLPALKALLTSAIERTLHRSAPVSGVSGRKRHTSAGESGQSFSKARARADAIPLDDYSYATRSTGPSTKSVSGQIVVEREYLVH